MNSEHNEFEKAKKDRLVLLLRPVLKPILLRFRSNAKPEEQIAQKYEQVVRTKKKAAGNKPFMMRFSPQDQILFSKRLGMILRSGMPIMEGLHMLKEEAKSSSAIHIYGSLIDDVSEGQQLSTGLAKFKRYFGEFCVNIIRVGEASGTLHQNLEYLAEELKKKQTLKRKVVGALVYPAVIIVATIGIVVMLTVYIFPKILPIFAGVNMTLPLPTRILIFLNAFLSQWGLWLLGGLILFIIAFAFAMRLPTFHLLMDKLLLRTPLFGSLSRCYNLSNSCRTLSILLRSDVRILEAMELVADSTRNLAYRNELQKARTNIMRGQKIAASFKENPRLFPALMTQMVTVGESTGNLSGTLEFLSTVYEEDINDLTKNLTTLLEPILMLIMGVIVGFIAVSIISPIYGITQSINPPS